MPEYLELLIEWLKIPVVQAVLCVVASILAAKLVDWAIIRVLSRLVNRTKSTIDDKIIPLSSAHDGRPILMNLDNALQQ